MQQAMIADGTLACTPRPTLVGRKLGCGTPLRDLSENEIEHTRWNGQGPRTYLDDVPLQLRLLSRFLRADKSDLGA